MRMTGWMKYPFQLWTDTFEMKHRVSSEGVRFECPNPHWVYQDCFDESESLW